MSTVTVVLSEQDLGDFLDGNRKYMDAYRDELFNRLSNKFDGVSVEISRNALSDHIDIDGEPDDGTVAYVLDRMVNDWSWLPE